MILFQWNEMGLKALAGLAHVFRGLTSNLSPSAPKSQIKTFSFLISDKTN